MTTFYTATNGNNGNNGTSTGTPFLTIAKGISVLTAGDTLSIRAGTYNESINTQSQTVPTGTSWSTPVTITAYPGETVRIRPASGANVLNIVGGASKYLVFDRLIFDGANISNVNINLDGLMQSGAGRIRFTGCEMVGGPDNLILIGRGADYCEVLQCHIHNNFVGNVGTRPDGHGVYIGASYVLVQGCDVHHLTGYGIHVYNGYYPSRPTNNCIIRNNRVYQNTTYNNQAGGILIGSGDGHIASNNIVYNQANGIIVGFYNSTNSKVYNNTVYNNSTDGIQIRASSSTAIVKNNIAYSNGTNIHNYNTTGGTTQSNNLVSSNPLFVNVGAGDFHLQAGSPARDAGVVLSEVPRDFDNGVRPVGTAYDIGAYEYASVVPPPPPVEVPDPPLDLAVTVLSADQLRLTWVDNSNRESGQEIERSLTGTGGWVRIMTVGANVISYVDAGLPAATTQYYRVRAINVAGSSLYSNIASATTTAAPAGGPAAPSSLNVIAVSATRIDGTFTDNATDETGFTVERSLSEFSGFTQIATISSAPSTTRLSLHVTTEELAIWQARAASGPYKSSGDVSTNSPGDWDRIVANKNAFASNPSNGRWTTGPPNLTGGYVNTTGNLPPDWGTTDWAIRLRDAAFYDLVMGVTTNRAAIKSELLWLATVSWAQFGNPSGIWGFSVIWDSSPGFAITSWLTRILFAYDYVGRAAFSQSELDTLDRWFFDAADYWRRDMDVSLDDKFVDRWGGNLTVLDTSCSNGVQPYVGGPFIADVPAKFYNNRRGAIIRFTALAALYLTHAGRTYTNGRYGTLAQAKQSGEMFVKEFVRFSVFPEGAFGDMERRGDGGITDVGWAYSGAALGEVFAIADAWARTGDTSLYTFSTALGMCGTAGTINDGGSRVGQNRDLLFALQAYMKYPTDVYARYWPTSGVADDRIDGRQPRNSPTWAGIHDTHLVMANVYFQDTFVKQAYTRTHPNSVPYPSSPIGGPPEWQGENGVFPAMLFMFGQMEVRVNPFLQAVLATGPVVFSDTGRTPNTEYFYRVRSFNNAGVSAYSNTDSATTSAAPGSVPNAPTDLTVTVISYRQLDLMWVLNGGNPDGVYIERAEDGLSYSQIALVVGSGVIYFSDLSCREATTYWYRVRLYNEAGPSAYSNITNATTPAFDGLVFTEEQLASLLGLAPSPASEDSTVEYWRHLAGLYRGPFEPIMAPPRAPNPNVGIITLGDLYAMGGPYYYSSFEPPDGVNAYHGRILANVSLTKEQADVLNGIPGKREAQLELSNLNVNPEAPTISEIEAGEDPIGLYFPCKLYDLTEQLDLFRLDGHITSYQPGVATTAVTIAIDEPKVLSTPLPKVRTATIFPNLDLSTFSMQNPVVLVVFGPWRKVPVGLCRTDNLTYWDYGAWRKATAGQVTAVNVYRDGALVSPAEYTIVEPVTGYECVRFTLDQLDRGRPLQIVIDFTTTEFSQNPAHAIKFLLNDSTYGLGQGVDIAAFNVAAIDFNSLPIRMGGGLSEQQEARVYLQDMLFHGSYLERLQGGAYGLYVDTLALHPQHEDANFQLGFGLEDWHNISNDPATAVRDESQRLAELSIEGGWDPYFNGNGSYHIHTKRTRVKVGTTKKLQNRFLFDGQSIDRQNHYLWTRINARDKQFPIDSITESYVLDVGHLVKTTIPTMQLDHTVMEVIRRTFSGGTSAVFSYLITPWDVAAYNYVPGVIEQDKYADTLLDYRRTPPTEPTNFTAAGDIRSGESLLIESVVRLSAKRPVENITHVKFVAYRHTVPPSAVPVKEIEVDITKQLSIDLIVTGELVVFPGLAYDFECFAINKGNDPDRQESSRAVITNFTGFGDTVPPAPPTNLDAKRGSLRTVFLTWVASLDAPKVREYWVERDTISSFPSPVIVAKVKTTNYTDTNTPYDATFYYRAKAVSRSDVSSIWSNIAVMTVVRAQPSDYGKDSQYRYHRAPLNQIISGVVVSAHSAFSYSTGIDATKYEWQAGALGTPQATNEWDSFSYSGGSPLGTRLFEFVASGGFQGPFNTDFWAGFWNGTNDTLNSVVRYMGS